MLSAALPKLLHLVLNALENLQCSMQMKLNMFLNKGLQLVF